MFQFCFKFAFEFNLRRYTMAFLDINGNSNGSTRKGESTAARSESDSASRHSFSASVLGAGGRQAGTHTRPLFGSSYAHFVDYVGCMISPQSIRQGDTGRCDPNGLR